MSYYRDPTCAIYIWIAAPKRTCNKPPPPPPIHTLQPTVILGPKGWLLWESNTNVSDVKPVTCVILLKHSQRTCCLAKKGCTDTRSTALSSYVTSHLLMLPFPVILFQKPLTVHPVIMAVSFTFPESVYTYCLSFILFTDNHIYTLNIQGKAFPGLQKLFQKVLSTQNSQNQCTNVDSNSWHLN